jgi:hypothetical protein
MRWLLLLALAACGAPIVSKCRYGPIVIEGRVRLDCEALTAAGDTLRALYTKPLREAIVLDPEAGYSFEDPWPSPSPVERWGGFDEAFEGYIVVIDETLETSCGTAGCHRGAVTELGLAGAPGSWGHESLHFLECRAGDCDNVNHVGWDINGYQNFGDAYWYAEHNFHLVLDTGTGSQ